MISNANHGARRHCAVNSDLYVATNDTSCICSYKVVLKNIVYEYFLLDFFGKESSESILLAMEENFVNGDSTNLPRLDAIMVASFFATNPDFCSAEYRNVKTSVSVYCFTRQLQAGNMFKRN